MKLLKYLPVAFIILFQFKTFGQNQNTPAVPQPIPPSPNAASLGKYGDIPVGKYTGVPDISIPLYTVEEGDIKVPISLSYHASGVKVEENASWVGLGWSLNAGGVITRSVRGKPDELGYLFSDTYGKIGNPAVYANTIPSVITSSNIVDFSKPAPVDIQNMVGYMFNAFNGVFDSEPDIYYFNFGGMSGKFVLDQSGNAYTIPYQKIQIKKSPISDIWTITTPDGYTYTFGATEISTPITLSSYNYGGPPGDGNGKSQSYTSAWYLSKITSPTLHHVDFYYTREQSVTTSGWSQSLVYATLSNIEGISNPKMTATATQNNINGLRLSEILSTNSYITFNATTPRTDLDDYANPNMLNSITISNYSGRIKQFVFNMDYFTTNDKVQTSLTKRLRLNSVTEWDGNLTVSKQPYQFTYDTSYPLPSKISSSQDDWGFYNGKNNVDAMNNQTLIPSIDFFTIASVNETIMDVQYREAWSLWNHTLPSAAPVIKSINVFNGTTLNQGMKNIVYKGADRSPDFNYAKAGILTKITYPTGGYTTFTYEPHDFNLGTGNYLYATKSYTVSSISTNDNNVNQGGSTGITTVVDDGTICTNTQTFNPSLNISTTDLNLNGTISLNLTFSFNNGGPDNGSGMNDAFYCGFDRPRAQFIDVTQNIVLMDVLGQEAYPITYDKSIVDQINAGSVQLSGNFTYPQLVGNIQHWNNNPFFTFNGLQLDPTHTYKLVTTTYHNSPGNCERWNYTNMPKPTAEVITLAGAYVNYNIKSNQIIQYNGSLGGLRIKQIADFSNSSAPIIKNYTYKLSSNPQISSGVILDWPIYSDTFKFTFGLQDLANGAYNAEMYHTPSLTSYYSHQELVYHSGSKFELGQTNGSYVGYKEVDESYCADASCSTLPIGKKIYRYTSADDYPNFNSRAFGSAEIIHNPDGSYLASTDPKNPYAGLPFSFSSLSQGTFSQFANIYPYPPKTDYDFKRGLLLSEETYDATGALKKKLQINYNPIVDQYNSKVIFGIKMGTPPNPFATFATQFDWSFGRYDIIATWNYKTQDITTDYDNNGNAIVTTTNYFYDNPSHAQLTRTETINSKGETIQTKIKYPGDEANIANLTTSQSQAITNLETQFRFATVLEKEENRNGILMNRTRTNYKSWVGDYANWPESVQMQIGTNPIETRLNYQQYDVTNGNILQFAKTNGPSTSFIWGYNKQYPIAQASNAKSNNIFFDSFEEGNGNIGTAKTGHYGFSGTYSKPLTGLDAGSYTLSYWQLVNGTWALVNTPVTVTGTTYTIKLTGQIDDVRFYPVTAQMTTYTYDPLIGETSVTDPKGEITYYEYDALQRLINIKDKDGNIIKHIDYHYLGQ